MTKEREFIVEACKEVLDTFSDIGFSTAKSGLKASRILNKDIKQEIQCQIAKGDITIHFYVSSKKMKKWFVSKYSKKNNGIIAVGQLGYLTPLENWPSWYIGTSEIAKKKFQEESSSMINSYLIPFFDQLNDIPSFIDYICASGGNISKYSDIYWIAPLCFVLVYGNLEKAQLLFDNYLIKNKYVKSNILKHNLSTTIYNPTGYISSFMGSEEISIALDNGVNFVQ